MVFINFHYDKIIWKFFLKRITMHIVRRNDETEVLFLFLFSADCLTSWTEKVILTVYMNSADLCIIIDFAVKSNYVWWDLKTYNRLFVLVELNKLNQLDKKLTKLNNNALYSYILSWNHMALGFFQWL